METKKMFDFYWNCLKSDFLTNLGGFEWFLFIFFLILFNAFNTGKIEKHNF